MSTASPNRASAGVRWLVAVGLALPTLSFRQYLPAQAPSSPAAKVRRTVPEKLEPALSLQGHSDKVFSVLFSPDGERLVSTSDDKTVRIWESATGKPITVLRGHTATVYSVAFSPDGKRLATAAGHWEKEDHPTRPGEVKVWEMATGKELLTLKGLPGPVYRVAFSRDGGRLATAGGESKADGSSSAQPGVVKVWDAATGKEVLSFSGPAANVYDVGFSPDGKRLLTAGSDYFKSDSPGAVNLWDSTDGKELLAFTPHPKAVYSATFSPDGARLATAGADKTVRLWDAAAGKLLTTLGGNTGQVYHVAFSPTGDLLAAVGKDMIVRIWNLQLPNLPLVFTGHADEVNCVAFSPDGKRLATGGRDHLVKVWNVAPLAEAFRPRTAALPRPELEKRWKDLAANDAAQVYGAIWTLAQSPKEAIPFFHAQFLPPKADNPRIARLIDDLNSDLFAVREKAHRELEQMGTAAEASLRRTLANPASQEVRRRIERLLTHKNQQALGSPDASRLLRVIALLEHAATLEARKELEMLAGGMLGSQTAEEAKAALERLDNG